MIRFGLRVVLLLGVVLSAAGCSRVRRVHDCQRAAGLVNAALDAIQPLTARQHDAVALRAMADHYDALSKKLAADKPADPKLLQSVGELGKLFKATAQQVRALAVATDLKQQANVFLVSHQLEELTRRERAEAYRLDGLCHGP